MKKSYLSRVQVYLHIRSALRQLGSGTPAEIALFTGLPYSRVYSAIQSAVDSCQMCRFRVDDMPNRWRYRLSYLQDLQDSERDGLTY